MLPAPDDNTRVFVAFGSEVGKIVVRHADYLPRLLLVDAIARVALGSLSAAGKDDFRVCFLVSGPS